MRIWSIHPKHLDTKGLVALWRETLLAKHVLEGKIKGYKNHPQLTRFKNAKRPLVAINYYLKIVWEEATARNYNFDKSKFDSKAGKVKLTVTSGQIEFEKKHILKKTKLRSLEKYKELKALTTFQPHPIFSIVKGDIEDWESI
jgi:hypothetical protein